MTISGGALDGKDAISSDGIDDAMALTGLSAAAGPLTEYWVLRHPNITDSNDRRWLSVTTGPHSFGIRNDDYAITDASQRRWTSTDPSAFSGRITTSMSGTSAELWIDDASQGSITTGGEPALGGNSYIFAGPNGGAYYAQIDVVAVYLYTAAHDSTQRQAVWDYIMQEWGV